MKDSDERLGRIEDKIDKLSDRIGSIDITLAAQHESLREHIRRTELLENTVEPIKKHVVIVGFIGRILTLLIGSELVYLLIERFIKK